ncbi:heparinase II/III-family protein [Mobilicoccus massiliensis]|nr:heparinase II/III-family protein [Mobilicoccus massiliensis]
MTAAFVATTLVSVQDVSASAAPATGGGYPCRGYGLMNYSNPVTDLDQDRFTWNTFKRTKVGNGMHDINWKLDPYRQDSWKTLFHTLNWTGAYIDKSTRGITKLRDPKAIDKALVITQDWVRDNKYPWPTGPGAGNATHTRADFMMCLRDGLAELGRPAPKWLDASLLQHAEWLKKNTWKDHNVGTEQTLAVLGVGCTLGRRDHVTYGVGKLSADITRVIDSQGANNEQAVGYARYNYALWGYVGNALTGCNISTPAARTIQSRRAGLQTFLDFALKPDGTYQQLGDTQIERPQGELTPAAQWITSDGKAGAPPAQRVKIYNAGYVFGRSGWGTRGRTQSQESAYALRFGPLRAGHGHSDHTAITWNTQGRSILADTGTGSYNQDAWRLHYIGPEAHNQLVVAGMRNGSATKLVRSKIADKADFYQFSDTPYLKTNRSRSIIVLSDPDIVVAFDKATSYKPTTFTQYWHLPYDVSLRTSGTRATASKGNVTTTLLQLPAAGAKQAPFGQVKGSTKPIQGWQWTDYFHKYKAPVATVTQKGASAAMVTAIVAAPGSTPVAVKPVISGSTTTYTFTVGSKTAVVTLDGKGTLTRVR